MARVERIVESADFERVLKAPPAARTEHFAVHHLTAARPARAPDLSTGTDDRQPAVVDDSRREVPFLGYVVPKRHARRAVTRSLLKRQIRAAVDRQAGLSGGLWVVRLRAGFDRAAFPSAASPALARSARAELDVLLQQAARRVVAAAGAPAGRP